MKNVCLIGVKNIYFEKTILKFVSDYIYVSESELKTGGLERGRLLLYDTAGEFVDIGSAYDGFVFKNDFFEPFDYRLRLKDRSLVFVSDSCPRAIENLKSSGIRYNICGMNSSFNVSPSSISDDSLTVCFRSLISADGRIICENDEIKVRGAFNLYNLCPAMLGIAIDKFI